MINKAERKLVKKTVIPVSIIDLTKDINGIVHFPTQQNISNVFPNTSTIKSKKHTITYRREAIDENEEEESRKKDIDYYEIGINPSKTKQKQFKVEVPVTRGYKSTKNYSRSNDLYFNFSFSNNQGRLFLLNGIQDAKMQIIKKTDKSAKQKIDHQLSILDNRRNGPIYAENQYHSQDDD